MSTTALIPADISAPLMAVAERQRRLRIARALIMAVGICAAIAMVAVLLLGEFSHMPASLRWAIAGGTWAAMAWTLWRLLRGSLKRVDLLTAAGTVETARQSDEEMLLSAVQLSADDQAKHIASGELVDRVIHTAGEVANQIDARQIITLRTLLRAVAICLPAVAVWFIVSPLMPNTVALGVRRALLPWSRQMPLSAMHLTVSPGSVTIGQGSDLLISARDDAKVAPRNKLHLELALRYADGRDATHTMTPTGPRSYRRTFKAVQTSFQYRIISRRGQSRWYAVHVIERPAISGLTIRYTYPPYTHLPPHQITGTDGAIRGIIGTQVSVTVHATEPLSKRSALVIAASPAGGTELARLHHTAGTAYRAIFTLAASTHYQIDLINRQHIPNRDNRVWPISVFADPLPVVHVTSPRGVVRARPDDVIPIRYVAKDRFGITSLRVRVKVGAMPSMSYPINIGTRGGRQYTGTWRMNIANQLLAANEPHARAIIYRLVVEDNCMPAHQTGLSGEHEIKIDPNLDMSYQARRDAILYRRFAAAIKRSIDRLRQARQQIANLQRVPANRHFNASSMRTANHAQNLIQQSAANVTTAASRMHRGIYRQTAQRVKAVAKTSMAAAAKNLALATFDNPKLTQQRSAQLADAQQSVSQALKQLHAAAAHLQQKAGVQVIADSVKALAKQQASVSRQLSIQPDNAQAMARQRQIENQLQQLIRQHPELQKPTQEAAFQAINGLSHELQQVMAAQQSIRRTINAKLHQQQALNKLKALQARQQQLNQAIQQFMTAQKRTPAGRDIPPISHTAMQTAVNALQHQQPAAAHTAQKQIAAQLQRAAAHLQQVARQNTPSAAAQQRALAAQRKAQGLLQAVQKAKAAANNKSQLQQLAGQIADAARQQAASAGSHAARQLYRNAQSQADAAGRAAAKNNMAAMKTALQAAAVSLARGAQAQKHAADQKPNPQQLTSAAQRLSALARQQRQLAGQTGKIARQLAAAQQPSSQSIARSTQVASDIRHAASTAGQLERQTALGAPALAAAIAQAQQQMKQARADQQSTNQALSQHNHVAASIHQQAALAHIKTALADLAQGMHGDGTEPQAMHNDHIAGEMNPNQPQQGPHSAAAGTMAKGQGKARGGSQSAQSEYQRLMAAAQQLQQALSAAHTAAQGNSSAAQAAAGALSQANQSLGAMGLSNGQSSMSGAAGAGQAGTSGAPGQGTAMADAPGGSLADHSPESGAGSGTGIGADNATGQEPKAVSELGISPAQWIKLGALRQKQLLNTARQSIPPGYRQMVRDYYVKIAQLDTKQ